MTELVSVGRLVRTVAFGSYAAPVALNGCRTTARSESVTRAGERASLIASFRDTRESARCKAGSEFVDGCDRREIRSLIGVAPGAASNRVGRAVRESATLSTRKGASRAMGGNPRASTLKCAVNGVVGNAVPSNVWMHGRDETLPVGEKPASNALGVQAHAKRNPQGSAVQRAFTPTEGWRPSRSATGRSRR